MAHSLLRVDALKPHLTTVMKRFKEAVTDNHFLANLRRPKYKGKQLSQADEDAAHSYLLTKNDLRTVTTVDSH